MATATVALVELDTNASIIEAAAKRVHLALHQSSAIAVAGVGCLYLKRARSISESIRTRLSKAVVQTADDRMQIREIAASLSQAALALDKAYSDAERRNFGRIPVFGPRLMSELEEIACAIEDVAETAALASSEAFAEAIRAELRKNLEDHSRQHAIA